jgi:AraC family transcriptional regulator
VSDPTTVSIVTLAAQPTLTARFRVSPEQMGPKLAEVLPAIFDYTMENGLELAGHPFSRYHHHDEAAHQFDLEAGLPITEPAQGKDWITASELPAGRAATLWHVGPYEKLGEAHWALRRWVEENGHTPAGGPWEVYVTDPGAEPDPNQWRTQLFQPVQD